MIDTNVWISALLSAGTSRLCLETIWISQHRTITSLDLETELEEVFQRKKLELVKNIRQAAEWVQPDPAITGFCRDPDDDTLLACASSGSADLILTGDDDLLTLHPFRGIGIVTPRSFLNQFAHTSHSPTRLP